MSIRGPVASTTGRLIDEDDTGPDIDESFPEPGT